MFHKTGTPLFFCNNFSKTWTDLMTIEFLCFLGNIPPVKNDFKIPVFIHWIFLYSTVKMLLRIVAHYENFNQPANSQRVYPSKIAHDKMPAVQNFHILCSNCPSLATTQTRSLFCHSRTILSMMRRSSLSRSTTMRSCRWCTSLILVFVSACPQLL